MAIYGPEADSATGASVFSEDVGWIRIDEK